MAHDGTRKASSCDLLAASPTPSCDWILNAPVLPAKNVLLHFHRVERGQAVSHVTFAVLLIWPCETENESNPKNGARWTFPLRLRPKKTNSRCDQRHREKQISPGLVPPPCVVLLWLQAQKGRPFWNHSRGRVDCEVRLAAATSHIKWLMVSSLYKNTFGFKFH